MCNIAFSRLSTRMKFWNSSGIACLIFEDEEMNSRVAASRQSVRERQLVLVFRIVKPVAQLLPRGNFSCTFSKPVPEAACPITNYKPDDFYC